MRTRRRLLAAALLLAGAGPVGAAEIPARVVFRNNLPDVRVQDPEAGIYFVKLVLCAGAPADRNADRPDVSALRELKTITYGREIKGKDLPGRVFDISKKDLEARKKEDPSTLILANRKRTIHEGPVPGEAQWLKVRYDTAVYTRRMKDTVQVPGARNWLAVALPILPEDRWQRLPALPSPCATWVVTITALVKGVHDDERDFTASVEGRCE